MITLTVKQNRIGPIVGGHPWVFSQAFTAIPDRIPAGEPVRIMSEKGEFLAFGYFSSYSQITVRIWGHDKSEKADERFFEKRIEHAYALRRRYVETPETNAFRLVNGENDLLPGLIVDKYGDYLVVQFHTVGIEAWKKEIISALETILKPKGIYERSDVAVRKKDNAEGTSGPLAGSVPDIILIREGGFTFLVDVKKGQKTGFFLDQRDKRKAVMSYTKDASVLNCFSYTGGFSVYALAGGARLVVSVDTSEAALDLARENIAVNGFNKDNCEFICQDVKRYLRDISEEFDVIILDPPAFIKDRRKKKEGIAGYKSINEWAIRLLPEEGILLTCSCSTHLSLEEFKYLLSEAGGKAKKTLRFLETFTHGIDHPLLVPFIEGEYLKCFVITL
ncbi:MAG: 23S rRNA (cytosine(1962)-C(5))-methyltransferase RlmI [Syntrophus sp. (in: bacteria)]|nr:23S rRNA (cytosine(1962)-C(5))-methyltransferase RlmI [Syntrophus sp. (in: bacteria)]